jgi:hypothetical protein
MTGSRVTRFVLISMLFAWSASAQILTPSPTVKKILGDPLTIHVGSDTSFQIFNRAVPGSGQIFPSGCQETADMGVFADIDGVLFAPSFNSRPCGTATSGLGTYTKWSGSIGEITGLGTAASPFSVTARVTAPGTGVTMAVNVSYVNGQNYFRVRKTLSATAPHTINVYFGADIYLASSDAGIFTFEPQLQAPGGHNCATPATYNILFIPITLADGYTSSGYSDVWRQIGANELDNDATEGGCVDNGAALVWKNALGGRLSRDINSAVSFGDIPPVSAFSPLGFSIQVNPEMAAVVAGQVLDFDVQTRHSEEAGFNSPISLAVEGVPEGITATLDHTVIPAPGTGTAKLNVQIGPDVFPQLYRGLTVVGTGGEERHGTAISLDVLCDPPFLLSLPTSQPQSQTVTKGGTVKLTVKSERSGAATYQWYSGPAPLTFQPIPNSDSATYETPPINELQQYWVRVTNACGSADSSTATIFPVNN